MRLIVYLPLVIPLLAAAGARPLAARLDPRLATWLLTGAALGLAAASTIALGLLAATAVIRIPLVAALGHWSVGVLGRVNPAGTAVAVAAGVLLAGLALAAGHFAVRRYRALADAYRHARRLPGRRRYLVVTDDDAADAYALPGLPGRVVVSARMLDALDDNGQAALLAHERAHLTGFHHLFTSAVQLAAAANPLLRPVATAVDYTVERWADERAAAAVGDRRLVAQAIATAAIAAKSSRPRRLAQALGIGGRTGTVSLSGAGPVPRRVAALLAPPPGRQTILLVLTVALVAAAGLCAIEAARDLHALLQLAYTRH